MRKVYIGIQDKNIKNLVSSVHRRYPFKPFGWECVSVSTSYASYSLDEGFPCGTTSTLPGSGSLVAIFYCTMDRAIPTDTEQVIYASIKVKSSSSNPSGYPVVRFVGYTYENLKNFESTSYELSSIDGKSGTQLNDGNWHKFSSIVTNRNSDNVELLFGDMRCYIQLASGQGSAGNTITIKDAIVVNLTEIFGSGNEPTQAWCDEHIAFLDNIVPDGNMESSSWSGGNYSTTEKLFGTRSQYFPANSTTVQTISTPIMPVVGHKYYGRHYLKTDGNVTAADCRFEWFAGDGPGLNYVFGHNQGNYPNWTMESSIVTVDAVNGSSYICRSFDVNNTGAVWADGLMIVDLTEAFGSGNEPTKQWCDEHIPFFDDTYCLFDTDIEVQSKARKVKAIYTGVNNVARKVNTGYIGINSTARGFFGDVTNNWEWRKYEYEYVSQLDSEGNSGQPGAFYAGTTYSINQTTGMFEVECTTQITNNSSGATNAVGKYFVAVNGSYPSSSGTYSGQYLHLVTASNKPLLAALKITYSTYGLNFVTGEYTSVFNTNLNQYPLKGIQNGYYYVLQNEAAQLDISYSGSYVDEIVNMDDGWYRLLTFTESGNLQLEQTALVDIWACGAGAAGGSGNGNYGGAGAYARSLYSTPVKNLSITIPSSSSSQGKIFTDVIIKVPRCGYDPYDISSTASSTGSCTGGTGSGQRGSSRTNSTSAYNSKGMGDGNSKLPFNDHYFPYPFCDSGGGGRYKMSGTTDNRGGDGNTNGGNGNFRTSYFTQGNTPAILTDGSNMTGYGLGGGHYGGRGAEQSGNGVSATGYGSGGGGGYYYYSSDNTTSTTAGSGYQGVCFIRIPLLSESGYQEKSLPSGYTRLEYVESNGNQDVNTGVAMKKTLGVICTFSVTSLEQVSVNTARGSRCIFSSGHWSGTSTSDFFGLEQVTYRDSEGYSTYNFYTGKSQESDVFMAIVNNIYTASITPGSSPVLCTVNSFPNSTFETATYYSTTLNGDPTDAIHIFAESYNSYNKSKMKLYNFKIYDKQTLVRDMVPAQNSSNVAGLYDLVNDVFYTSISGTDLIAGPVVS